MTELKKIVGYYSGSFTPEGDTKAIAYTRLCVVFPRDGVTGLAADVCKVKDEEVLKGVEVGDFAEVYYDEKRRIVMINPVVPTENDLIDFGEKEQTVSSLVED